MYHIYHINKVEFPHNKKKPWPTVHHRGQDVAEVFGFETFEVRNPQKVTLCFTSWGTIIQKYPRGRWIGGTQRPLNKWDYVIVPWEGTVSDHVDDENKTNPKFNMTAKAPPKNDGTGRLILFLLGFGNFSGAFAVKLQVGNSIYRGEITTVYRDDPIWRQIFFRWVGKKPPTIPVSSHTTPQKTFINVRWTPSYNKFGWWNGVRFYSHGWKNQWVSRGAGWFFCNIWVEVIRKPRNKWSYHKPITYNWCLFFGPTFWLDD